MRLLSLFSGVGAFEKALDRAKIKYELVGYSENDKFASRSYCAIHGVSEEQNLGDITKINEKTLPKNIDLITYGFPCQDISISGKQKGFLHEDGTRTRSGLFFDALKIIEETQPKIAIAENVKNLTSKRFAKEFKIVLDSLEVAGYNNYWQILNTKDFGIPQNRERVFIVSVRKDVDSREFKFPEGFPLKIKLKDILEKEVDEKFYLPSNRVVKKNSKKKTANNTCKQVGQLYGTEKEPNPEAGRIYSIKGLSPALNTCGGGNKMPKFLVREGTKRGFAEAYEGDGVDINRPHSKTRRGRAGKQVAHTLTTSCRQAVVVSSVTTGANLRVRKMTPKECFRLMNFDDADFKKAETVNSNTQLYKQAGNSIVVSRLYYIFLKLCDAGILRRE